MLTIYLVRHAKSDWANGNIADIDRPLNDRGYRDAHFMGKLLKDKKINPDCIISSPAIRAISTALIFARNLNYDSKNILLEKPLYDSASKEYKAVVSKIKDENVVVILFGHNPTITNFANSLSSAAVEDLPTCAIVGIRFKTNSWKNISEIKGELFLFEFPKKHGQD